GWLWRPMVEGRYNFTSIIKTAPTSCNLSPTQSPGTSFSVDVLACEPYFNHADPPDDALTLHLPQGPITISVPGGQADLYAAAQATATAYTTGLAGTGISVTATTNSCSGAACVTVQTGTPNGGGCTSYRGSIDESTGVTTGNVTVTYPSD